MYSRPCSSHTRQPDERVIRLGRSGSEEPKIVSGRLLPVEVYPGMCSVTVPHAQKSAELQGSESRRILPIAPQPNPSSPAAPDQLAGSAQPIGKHLIDQQVEADLLTRPQVTPVGRGNGDREKVSCCCGGPAAGNLTGRGASAFYSPNDKLAGGRGNDQNPGAYLVLRKPDVQLNSVGVDLIPLVVQPKRRGIGISKDQLGFGHLDPNVQTRITPVDVGTGRKFFRAGIGLF